MIINIDPNLVGVLAKLAEGDNITPEVYVERKINAILLGQYKDGLIESIRSQKLEDIKTIETAVTSIKADIATRDYVAPKEIVIDIKPETPTSTPESI
jgi:hypothetical protein